MPLRRAGDFIVHERDLDRADERFGRLSNRRRKLDKATREPIPETREQWARDMAGKDFPGVDTPNDTPRQGQLDRARPTDDPSMGTIGLDVEERGFMEASMSTVDETNDMIDNLGKAIFDAD